MADTLCLSWDRSLLAYNFGPEHPMSPIRLDLTSRLIDEFGLFEAPGVRVQAPKVADDDLLRLVHTQDYIDAVRRASEDWRSVQVRYGLGTPDDPCFPGMHDASARIAEATVDVARSVWEGETEHGVSIAGGLHHAMPGHASGFCIYNDPAIAIAWLLDHGAERVAYVDIDVHHGDGVQTIFWDEPRVLTISVHEHPRMLFPGTGYPHETGGPNAEGSAANLALPPGTADGGWLRGFHAIVPQLLEAFRPQVLVSQHGCDSHIDDPLAHLALTIDGQRAAASALHGLAHELCEGRWVATGGGGYAVVTVVPRTWTHLVAEAAGAPIAPETPTPQTWRDYVAQTYRRAAPLRMTDGSTVTITSFDDGYDPADDVDRAILATRKAVFPSHGLDPHW
jgi:acetoin utilization protein AcuC